MRKKPTRLKEAQGNPGRRPLSKDEVDFGNEEIPVPGFLDEVGRQKYEEVVRFCKGVKGLLHSPDYSQLLLYAEAYQDFVGAMDDIKEKGATLTSEKGNPYQNPSCGRKNKAVERMLKLSAKFGFTPVDRIGLEFGSGDDDSGDSFEGWVAGKVG